MARVGKGRLGLGWAGLGWAGLGWAGLGWAGLGWAGLGWAESFVSVGDFQFSLNLANRSMVRVVKPFLVFKVSS